MANHRPDCWYSDELDRTVVGGAYASCPARPRILKMADTNGSQTEDAPAPKPNGNGSAKVAVRNPRGQFVKGGPSIGGRKLGSRHKLSEQFLADLQKQWRKSGKKALQKTADSDPVAFTKIVASLMPKEIDSTLNLNVDLFAGARTRLEAYRMARDYIGAEDDDPFTIEAEPIETENEQQS
jgi:hypothetical protein